MCGKEAIPSSFMRSCQACRRRPCEFEATDEGIAISGERSESRETEKTDRGYQLQECTYGSFYRDIPLPEGAQVDEAKATMREGVSEEGRGDWRSICQVGRSGHRASQEMKAG